MPFDEDVTVRVFDSDLPDRPLVGEWRGITLSGVPNQIHEIAGVEWQTVSWTRETGTGPDAIVFSVNASCRPLPSLAVEASAVETFNQAATVETATVEAFKQVTDTEAPEPVGNEPPAALPPSPAT